MARKNASLHRVRRKVRFLKSDCFSAFGKRFKGHWDLIVSNPPYIPAKEIRSLSAEVRRDPVMALDGGSDGLDIVNRILKEAPFYLKKNGALLMEIGKGQSAQIRKSPKSWIGFKEISFVRDLNGIERVLIAIKNG